ncbi:hypothetical protein [Ruegeria arenilitoris]|uniref:hypothetical protein n=1 Tax=Ruegeria arenilitoris TaxID=1173585 RepID=UPI001480E97A|nr:hypothetical protein [Ruegeria arenilitoris]
MAHIKAYLQSLDVSGFDFINAPDSIAKQQMIEDTRGALDQAMDEIVQEYPVLDTATALRMLRQHPETVHMRDYDLAKQFRGWRKRNMDRSPFADSPGGSNAGKMYINKMYKLKTVYCRRGWEHKGNRDAWVTHFERACGFDERDTKRANLKPVVKTT